MNLRLNLFISFIFLLSVSSISAFGEFDYLNINQEPIIRIGLTTNASSVSITTTDSSLVAVSPDEPPEPENAWRNFSTSLKNRGIKFSSSEKSFGT